MNLNIDFKAITENSPDIITRWNRQCKLIYANAGFEAKTGMKNGFLIGKTKLEMGLPADIALPWAQSLKKVFKTGMPTEHYNHFPLPHGNLHLFSRMVPELDERGKVQSVLAVSRDITTLKKIEETLKEQAHFIEQISNAMPDMLYVIDPVKKEISYVNERVQQILNIKPADIYKRGLNVAKKALLPADYERYIEHLDECTRLKDNQVKEIELPIRTENKTMRWFRIRDKVFKRNADGSAAQLIGIAQDIDDHIKVREKFTADHRRLKEAQAIGHIGSFEWQAGDIREYWTDELYHIYGIKPRNRGITVNELLGFVHKADRPELLNAIKTARNAGQPTDITHQIIRKDGTIRYIQRRSQSIFDEKGRIRKVYGTVQDITDIKQAEKSLRKTTELLESIFNTTTNGIFVLRSVRNTRGRLIGFKLELMNRIAQDMIGGNLVGESYTNVFPAAIAGDLFHEYRKVIEENNIMDVEQPYEHFGTKGCLHLVAVKLNDGLVATWNDITNQKKLEKERRELEIKHRNEILDAQEIERKRIAEAIHNEIGQLLSIAKMKISQNGAEAERILNEAIKKVRNISFELMPAILYDFGLEAAIVDLFQSKLRLADITYNLNLTGTQLQLAKNAELAIFRIIQELITNVIKHSGADHVNLTISKEENWLVIYFTDNGKGFKETDKKPRFGWRTMADRINRLNGEYEINTAAKKGSEIIIRIPVKAIE
ncbi:PAS domain-containing protein [Pedobacter sp. BS3]|uniref:PAS domain-containing sensor histidine kinase n=1 Tax=Pedobacter sp. BS3 TaxID=2567937 RepID=UPI0011F0360D|nr:PAS domain-containing protein [Pedobacter sp. BS3]TZF83693.1 PAS domain-containing protein [Pedobacter sp. BS3]